MRPTSNGLAGAPFNQSVDRVDLDGMHEVIREVDHHADTGEQEHE